MKSLVPGYINDLEWNFYDELHRQYVHDTYHGLYKVMTGKYFSINVVRWGNLPIFMQVANAKIADGMFYQSMTVLGIIMLHQVQRISQKKDEVLIEVDWYTASHWAFRWLHGPFNRRLLQLQRKQDIEDNVEIRGRRRDLRRRGFGFATDDPDFVNSNRLTDNVHLPPLAARCASSCPIMRSEKCTASRRVRSSCCSGARAQIRSKSGPRCARTKAG